MHFRFSGNNISINKLLGEGIKGQENYWEKTGEVLKLGVNQDNFINQELSRKMEASRLNRESW